MKEIIRVFPINPVAASRPRVTRHATFYSKQYTQFRKDFKKLVGHPKMLLGTISVTAIFYIQMPKSWSKKKKAYMNKQAHISKPDIDNLSKAVLDGISGNYFHDDSQVAILHTQKYWAEEGKISMIVKEL